MVDAQQARRVLDRLVGYKISPLLWRNIRKGLSAGRVQSVATKIIKDREAEIQSFEPEEYWSLALELMTQNKETLEAKFHSDALGNKELKSKEAVDKLLEAIKGHQAMVVGVKKK